MPKPRRDEHRASPKCWPSFALESTTTVAIKWYVISKYCLPTGIHGPSCWVSFVLLLAQFPHQYLSMIRDNNLSHLQNLPNVTLRHSQPRSLVDPSQRNLVLHEFIAIICHLVDGWGNVGFFSL